MTKTLSAQKVAAGILAVALLSPMFAFAESSAKIKVDAAASTTPAQRTCMQAATSVKADANIAALDALFASFRSAFVAQKNATVAAWGNADGVARAQAILSANAAFSTSVKNSWKSFRAARADAAATYKASVEACGIEKISHSNGKKDDAKHGKGDARANIWSKFHLNLGLLR